MICPVCRAPLEVVSGVGDLQDAWRRSLSDHLEHEPHALGVIADAAARWYIYGPVQP